MNEECTPEEIFNEFKWFVIFYEKIDKEHITVHHMVGYQKYPKDEWVENNICELKEDKEFGLTDIIDNLEYTIIDSETAKCML